MCKQKDEWDWVWETVTLGHLPDKISASQMRSSEQREVSEGPALVEVARPRDLRRVWPGPQS